MAKMKIGHDPRSKAITSEQREKAQQTMQSVMEAHSDSIKSLVKAEKAEILALRAEEKPPTIIHHTVEKVAKTRDSKLRKAHQLLSKRVDEAFIAHQSVELLNKRMDLLLTQLPSSINERTVGMAKSSDLTVLANKIASLETLKPQEKQVVTEHHTTHTVETQIATNKTNKLVVAGLIGSLLLHALHFLIK